MVPQIKNTETPRPRQDHKAPFTWIAHGFSRQMTESLLPSGSLGSSGKENVRIVTAETPTGCSGSLLSFLQFPHLSVPLLPGPQPHSFHWSQGLRGQASATGGGSPHPSGRETRAPPACQPASPASPRMTSGPARAM